MRLKITLNQKVLQDEWTRCGGMELAVLAALRVENEGMKEALLPALRVGGGCIEQALLSALRYVVER